MQMGAALGRRVGLVVGSPRRLRRADYLRRGGGSGRSLQRAAGRAGLALEELQVRFNQSVFFAAAVAALLADVVARSLAGELPVFHVTVHMAPTVMHLPHALAVGVTAGLLGMLFNYVLIGAVRISRARPGLWLVLVGGLTVVAIAATAWFAPHAVGGGLGLTDHLLDGPQPLLLLVTLLVVRFLLTVGSYSLGSAGGIFAPMLLIGGLLGLGMGEAGRLLGIPWTPDPTVAALIGMAAFFGAVVRCPLTGIVLMVEMTGYYPMVLVLLAASFLAVGIADFFHQEPVYEALYVSLSTDAPRWHRRRNVSYWRRNVAWGVAASYASE